MTIGGVPDNSIRGERYSHDLIQRYDAWWTVKLSGLYYGDENIKQSRIKYAILDTGTSLIYMGNSDYQLFKEHVMEVAPDMDCSGIYCKSSKHTCDFYTPVLQPLTIQLGDNHYKIPPEGYTFSGDNVKKYLCTVAISFNDDKQGIFILGDTFLRNFVSIFDYNDNSIHLGVNANAPEGTSIKWELSNKKIALLVVAVMMTFLAICMVVKFCTILCKREGTVKDPHYVSIPVEKKVDSESPL